MVDCRLAEGGATDSSSLLELAMLGFGIVGAVLGCYRQSRSRSCCLWLAMLGELVLVHLVL